MHIEEEKLKEFILDSGLVSKSDFVEAQKEGIKRSINTGEILVNKGLLHEDDLRRIHAHIFGIPFVSLKNKKVDFSILSLIPEPIERNHNIIAFAKDENNLEVAMLDVEDLAAIDFVKKKVGLKILPRLTDNESIKSVLLQYQKTLKAEFGDIIKR
ncbi:hypothetical protein KJ828_00680, partial [Patescibacteria group bacterium]|nr:hypothetical protein [Patescibacteria group bacterium]